MRIHPDRPDIARQLRRVAASMLVVLLLGQASLLLHEIVAPHELGDVCVLCTTGDRIGHGVTAQPVTVAVPVVSQPLSAPFTSILLDRPAYRELPRGPPRLS